MLDIIIVEDNHEIGELLSDFLRNENYIVSVAKDGEAALELFERYGAKLGWLCSLLQDSRDIQCTYSDCECQDRKERQIKRLESGC